MRSLNYNGNQLHVFICSLFFSVANLCHEASRGQAVIYTNSLPQPFLDLGGGGGGVITQEQNGFISFNPLQQFTLLIFVSVESAQLESSKRQWGQRSKQGVWEQDRLQINYKCLCWHGRFAEISWFRSFELFLYIQCDVKTIRSMDNTFPKHIIMLNYTGLKCYSSTGLLYSYILPL